MRTLPSAVTTSILVTLFAAHGGRFQQDGVVQIP